MNLELLIGARPGDFLTIAELCDALGISRQYLHKRYVQKGEGPKMQKLPGGRSARVLIHKADAEAFVGRVLARRAATAAKAEIKAARAIQERIAA